MFNRKHIKIEACLVALLSFMFLTTAVFGQGAGSSLTGTVQDTSGGVVPGATVTVRNVDTGVETKTTSNDRGSYTFPSLQVGTYNITAEAPNFSRGVRNDVRLNVGGSSRLDFTLSVAGTVTEVEVTGRTDNVILEAGASTGTVLQQESLAAIPLLSNNVMDLINIMGGVTPITGDPVFAGTTQTFAGVSGNMVNVTRDGMSVTEVRNPTGVTAATNINTEMVGEFRMVLSPVDAEMGRGAGQVQMTTRSGSNAYHGSAIWTNQNTALDAQDFSNKQSSNPKSWRNVNDYMLTASGPIVRNRTFFFATWEQQIARDRQLTNTKVLTPCARRGIFRYLDKFTNASWNANGTYTSSVTGGVVVPGVEGRIGSVPSVGGAKDGTPITVTGGSFVNNLDSSKVITIAPGAIPMRIESVFGRITPAVRDALLDPSQYNNPHGVYGDCSDIAFGPADNPNFSFSGGRNTTGLYAQGFLLPNSYWGDDLSSTAEVDWLFRNAYDPTGFVTRFTFGTDYNAGRVEMPPANYYIGGDGLNTARYQWYNPIVGAGGSIYGTGGDPDRKSITVKLDHNVNNEHRLSGTYTYESFFIHDAYRQWPEAYGGYPGSIDRKPQSLMVSLTSTLRPTLLNEFRFGLSLSDTWTNNPYDTQKDGEKMRSVMQSLLPNEPWAVGLPLVSVGDDTYFGTMAFSTEAWVNPSHPFGSRGNVPGTWGGSDPRWTYADTLTWIKGSHSFKGGVEYRRQKSTQEFMSNRGFMNGSSAMSDHVVVDGGMTTSTANRRGSRLNANTDTNSWVNMGDGWNNLFGMYTGNFGGAFDLMSYFAGTVGRVSQYFYGVPDISSPTGSRWNNPDNPNERLFVYDVSNQELSFFFKDDWRLSNDLTLNLGVRYEYYGVPHSSNGMTLKINGVSSETIFGISPGGWDNWMKNRDRFYVYPSAPVTISGNGITLPTPPDPATYYNYIGPESPKSDVMAWHRDMNNFAPHLGFAWQLPWLGRGKTTLRGGWSISYSPVDNFNNFGVTIGDVGGISYQYNYTGRGTNENPINATDPGNTYYYMDLTDLGRPAILNQSNGLLDSPDFVKPLQPREVGLVTGFVGAMDENLRNPYTHSFNLSLTRNIGRNLTVDVRYIGTLGRSQLLSTDLNTNNYIQTGLWQELAKVRQGGESALINSLVAPGRLVSGTATGSAQVRSATGFMGTGAGSAPSTQSDLINGNFSGIVSTLSTTNGELVRTGTGNDPMTAGMLARSGCLPGDRPGYLAAFTTNPTANVNDYPCVANTPYNYFVTNPQFSSATIQYNGGISNYHSMQAQVTLRPTRGVNFQATWTWSRALGYTGLTDYTQDRITGRDYGLTGAHRTHALNTYGSWDLPFGPNGFLFRDASGAFKKAIEGWQLSWVTTMSTGTPMSVSGNSTLWGRSWPNLVRPDLWDNKAGKAVEKWTTDQNTGKETWSARYFGDRFTHVIDYNVCNNQDPSQASYISNSLFQSGCVSNVNGRYVPVSGAPRALALSTGELDNNNYPIPVRYGSLDEALKYDPYAMMEMAEDGTYSLLPSVIIFRGTNQWDGLQGSGNFKTNQLTGTGRITFDMALSKYIEFMEGKRFELRIDAQNILNHATPTNGTSSWNGGRIMVISNPGGLSTSGTGVFGSFTTKAGHRTFQAKMTLRF